MSVRPEEPSKKTGAYILTGPDPEDANQTMIYVGEGDNVGVRLSNHNKDNPTRSGEVALEVVCRARPDALSAGHFLPRSAA